MLQTVLRRTTFRKSRALEEYSFLFSIRVSADQDETPQRLRGDEAPFHKSLNNVHLFSKKACGSSVKDFASKLDNKCYPGS